MRAFIEGVGLCGPGLAGWLAARPVLAGEAAYVPGPEAIPPCALLPAAERRRAPRSVRLALAVGAEACAGAGRAPADCACVFASSGGDGETIHDILTMLAAEAREISPTKFHNSVHNAAAGYWSIATGATGAATALCAHDDSFAAGLLEAMAQVAASGAPVVLIACDVPYPAPLFDVRPVGAAFGAALLLGPAPRAGALAALTLELGPLACAATLAPEALEALRRESPAARALPLLCAVAQGGGEVVLDYLGDMTMRLAVSPP